jgi:CRP/FNR family transcriptional regulator
LDRCGELWREGGDPGSGWDLIQALHSLDPVRQSIAQEWLSQTREFFSCRRLLSIVPGGSATRIKNCSQALLDERIRLNIFREVEMNTPYGLDIIENCILCNHKQDCGFCDLSPSALGALSAVSHQSTHPGGAVLFVEGQKPRGAFVLCTGRVKLSTTSREGKVLILKIAEAGDVLGLSAVISGSTYELTAETAGPCQVNFVESTTLKRLVESSGEIGMHCAQILSREFQSAYRDIHDLVLARSSVGKLARLLLSWTDGMDKDREIRIHPSLTHEEMAQMIGSSRETVTRVLGDLKKKQFIRLEGSTLVIRNKNALEALAV